MEEPLINRQRRLAVWFIIAAVIFSVLLLAIVYFVDKSQLFSVVILCSWLLVVSVWMLISTCFIASFHCYFEDHTLCKQWAKFTYKRIPLSQIECIALLGELQRFSYSPVLDKHKKQRAVLVLFRTDISYFYGMICHDGQKIVQVLEDDVPYQRVLDMEVLKYLLAETDLPVYITEQMFALHHELFQEVLTVYPDRFLIAFYDKSRDCERRISYQEFLLYKKQNP